MEVSSNQQLFLSIIELASRIDRRAGESLSNIKGISLAEYRLLRVLADAPDAQSSRVALADAVGLTASGVTRALIPLEKIGYVQTVRDERDARKALASLTEAGVELVRDASGVLNDFTADLSFTRDQENDMLNLLSHLAGVVRRP
jgi:DNA-binding MarR family transcriptional regulator